MKCHNQTSPNHRRGESPGLKFMSMHSNSIFCDYFTNCLILDLQQGFYKVCNRLEAVQGSEGLTDVQISLSFNET